MHIERVTGVDDGLVAAVAKLIPQLNPRSPVPTRDDLALMVASPGTHLLLARDPDIIGTLTLTVFRTLVGVQARINTVVVDAGARGRGIGEALTREAVRISSAAGVRRITLSSRRERAAAHRMYCRVGFEPTPNETFHMLL
ncbi:MAG TPA: GNAT family N-acetyltransferase [Kofleriaceae bacterium]|jgi:ribosomal protein S18 acetylase RimI-like enzyme